MKYLLLLLLFLTACGDDKPSVIEPKFQPYVDTFISEAKARGVEIEANNVSVLTVDPADPFFLKEGNQKLGAACFNAREVRIRGNVFEKRSESVRRLIIFHELGHCILHLNHSESTDSVMFLNLDQIAPNFELHESEYLDRLFER